MGEYRPRSAAGIASALEMAKREHSPPIPGALWDPTGTTVIQLPGGDITIDEAYGLLGVEGASLKVSGLKFVGQGMDMTRVIFNPTASGALVRNDVWHKLRFEGIAFVAAKPGLIFMESHTTNSAQDYRFTDVAWAGPWRHGFDLRGDNNNSEFIFDGCRTSAMQSDGAFLHIGATNTSDQFVNYWFYGFKHWSTSAPIIDAARGGHFHFFGVDVSDWGADLTEPGHLFYLRGQSHAQGVTTMTAAALRVEAKSVHAGLIHSEWPDGNVDIQCDWSSQIPYYQFGDLISIDLGNTPGAVYNFHDSNFAGGIRVKYGAEAWSRQHRISVANCSWSQRLTPTEVVSYDESDAGGNLIRPSVEFTRCRGDHQDSTGDGGASVWDATVGYTTGSPVGAVQRRSLGVHGIYGSLRDSEGPMKVNLPVGALITGVRVVSPPTGFSDPDGGTWTVSTTEAAPETIASVTVSGDTAAGYNRVTELTVPYRCENREKANISIYSSGVSAGSANAQLLIEGYW